MEQVEMFPSVNPTDSTVPKAGAAEPASTATAHEEGEAQPPCCRICYGTEMDGEDGPLFRPCSCRGTMAWVHMECLDRWRKTSVNPRSFYRCDQCHFQYRLGRVFEAFPSPDRFSVARLLGMRFAVHVISVGALLSLVFFAGFFGKMISPELTWWDVLHCFNLSHMLTGSLITGVGSLIGFLVSSLGWGMPRFFTDIGLRGAGNWGGAATGDGRMGKVILFILVFIGLCIALTWIFGVIERYADRTARHARRMVLDAHHLHQPPGERRDADYAHTD